MASTSSRNGLIVITQGDPSGIGPEITLQAWSQRRTNAGAFAIIGDPDLYEATADRAAIRVKIIRTTWAEAASAFADGLPVIDSTYRARGRPGEPLAADAAGTLASIERAVQAVQWGWAAALVTNPIAKHVLYEAGFRHPGHTEYLGELAQKYWGAPVRPVMMLWSDDLAVVPVTIHIPLKAVPACLTEDLIVETARIVDRDLRERFGFERPRLVCAGLNPHAGEGGSMGREEIDVIDPALRRLRAEGIAIVGPLSADTLFHAAARKTYDTALTMYHDQGLIPIKTLSFDTGVNVTLGLPFVRTSPDHGTAFGIAGQGIASATSLIAAIDLAGRLAPQ